jgi:excinuclease UvrABC ATPase subunit
MTGESDHREKAAVTKDPERTRHPRATGRLVRVRGARTHNLQNVDVDLPRNQLVVVTGVSGSGKSSLLMDTVAAEAQRQFLEGLSTYSRLAVPSLAAPDVDEVTGLSPVLLVDQRALGRNPRSTVGTVTEAYTYLRLLYSRFGGAGLAAADFSFNTPEGACEGCSGLGSQLTIDLRKLVDTNKSLAEGAVRHRTWKVGSRYWNIIQASGLLPMDVPVKHFTGEQLDLLLNAKPRQISNEVPGYIQSFSFEGVASRLRKRISDKRGQAARHYDHGFFRSGPCDRCGGSRLNERARSVCLSGHSIVDLVTAEVGDLPRLLQDFDALGAELVLGPLRKILDDLLRLGLGYVSLSRSVVDLSGGESQRLKLARHLNSRLIEMIYVLDEPTVGIHASRCSELVTILKRLVNMGNSVYVIEHSPEFMLEADWVVDLGPGGGTEGGRIVAQGPPDEVARLGTATGRVLRRFYSTDKAASRPRRPPGEGLPVRDARTNNLRGFDLDIPSKCLVGIVGVSGAGKSSLVHEIRLQHPRAVVVDQGTVGKNARSNLLTYTKVFGDLRRLFARHNNVPESLFTFNGSGACSQCKGLGEVELDLHFLGSRHQTCGACNGRRYNATALAHRYDGKTIADVLHLTVAEASKWFRDSTLRSALSILHDVGLGYLRLGQPLSSLSGGEAQRLKLVSRLRTTSELYILDEPSRGLHTHDISALLTVLNQLVDAGNTVVIVEHDLQIILSCDWAVELGPGAGREGGSVVACGNPASLSETPDSPTGAAIARYRTAGAVVT